MQYLHPTQQKLLKLLKDNIDDPLTVRELQEELNVNSTSTVHHHITQLEKKGYLRRNPHNPSDYQVLMNEPDAEVAYLNVYGQAQCGPTGQLLTGNPVDRVPVSTKLLGFPSKEAFLIRAKGNSMDPKIKDGDVVIARKTSNAKNGSIVVCSHDGEAKIKQFQLSGDRKQVILTSLNPSYPPIVTDAGQLRVEGIVRGIISYMSV